MVMKLFNSIIPLYKDDIKVADAKKTHQVIAYRRLSYHVANIQKIGARERQEDSFAIINAMDVTKIIQSGMLAVVADGMGGMLDGKKVSESAVNEVVQLFHDINRSQNIPKQIKNGIYEINERLNERFIGSGGTTLVLVMLYNSALYWASVGDSAIFLKRNGGLFQLNCEHTYKNQLFEQELYEETLNREKVEEDEDGLRLSEFLGINQLGKIDFNKKPLILKAGDSLLLCSDGISKALTTANMNDALLLPPAQACEEIDKMIRQQADPFQDNYTGLIIACKY